MQNVGSQLMSNILCFCLGATKRYQEVSGQVRSYVRPVSQLLPLAIMGVRLHARHQTVRRAQSTVGLSVLPGLS